MSQDKKEKGKEMNWGTWLKKWQMDSLKISLPYLPNGVETSRCG